MCRLNGASGVLSGDLRATDEVVFGLDSSGLGSVSALPTVDTQTTATAFDGTILEESNFDGTILEGSNEGTFEGSTTGPMVAASRKLAAGKRASDGGSLCAAAARADIVPDSHMSGAESQVSGGVGPRSGASGRSRQRARSAHALRAASGTAASTDADTTLTPAAAAAPLSPRLSERTASVGTMTRSIELGQRRGAYSGGVAPTSFGRWRQPQTIYESMLSEATNTPRGRLTH